SEEEEVERSRDNSAAPLGSGSGLPRQLARAGGVLAVFPLDELAVLHHVFGDNRHSVLTVVVERDLTNDGVTILHVGELRDDLLAVRPDLLDCVEDQLHRGERERTVSLGLAVVFLSIVLLEELLSAGKLLGRGAFAE